MHTANRRQHSVVWFLVDITENKAAHVSLLSRAQLFNSLRWAEYNFCILNLEKLTRKYKTFDLSFHLFFNKHCIHCFSQKLPNDHFKEQNDLILIHCS